MPDTNWRLVADVLAERLRHHAFCEDHPRSRSAPTDCGFCADRAAWDLYKSQGGLIRGVGEESLVRRLRRRADEDEGPRFMGWPDSWWEAHRWRCPNDHVSTTVLRSEALQRDACLACRGPVHLTFPEDRDGVLLDV
jgi:hypothetical protein